MSGLLASNRPRPRAACIEELSVEPSQKRAQLGTTEGLGGIFDILGKCGKTWKAERGGGALQRMRLTLQARTVTLRQRFVHARQLLAGLGKKNRQRLVRRFPADIVDQTVENESVEIG